MNKQLKKKEEYMKENDEYDTEYDLIIDINSIKKLNNGWVIKYNGDDKRIKNTKEIIKSTDQNIISILGHSNRGKTYILERISNENLNPGYDKTTKGISVKIYGKNAIFLDTVGTNAPLLIGNEKEDPRDKDNFQIEMEDVNLCQIITNYIVQTFVIQYADILLCVVGMLTTNEQQFLNKIKKNCSGKKKLFVIHNLIQLFGKKQIEEYIENVLKKSITYELKEIKIPNVSERKNEEFFNKYYIEKNKGEGYSFDVLHFIMANDTKKDGEKGGRYFNTPTINFIRTKINQTINKDLNILEKLKEHIKNISNQVLENNITKIDIENVSNSKDLIKSDEVINPKKVTADVLDNIYFVGKDYEPPYRYYRKDQYFTIEIQICSKIKKESLDIKCDFFEENEEFIFEITGERLLDDNENSKNGFYEIINKRTWKNFKVKFKIYMKDYDLDGLDPVDDYKIKYGILYLNFKIT